MASYLFTWNPDKWAWADLADAVYRVSNGLPYDMYWSCGNTRKIEVGDTFLLVRVGVAPKGIIGCGYILSAPYEQTHWDAAKAEQGATALRTDLLFKALAETPIVGLAQLEAQYPSYRWTPQASGLSVPDAIADELLTLIQGNTSHYFEPSDSKELALYAEGSRKQITSWTYDRSRAARQACIEHYGYGCSVCGFNFEAAYGVLGARYIEVHHLKPVADAGAEYQIDPKSDLRPVCANCHRMLHKQRPPLSIEELLAHKDATQAIKSSKD